jgi:hypothetical protein
MESPSKEIEDDLAMLRLISLGAVLAVFFLLVGSMRRQVMLPKPS